MYGFIVKLVLVPLIVGALAITGYTTWFAGVSLSKEINKGPQPGGDTTRMPDPKKTSPGWITKLTKRMPGPEPQTNEPNGGDKFMTKMPFSRGIKLTTKNPSQYTTTSGSLEPCRTQECLKLDKHIIERMNQTINPCDNFYGFVCKNSQWNTKDEFIVSNNTIRSRLQSTFNNSEYSPNPNEPLNFAKQFYNLCIKQDLNGNVSELKNMINAVGGWSLLKSDWNGTQFSLANFYGKSVEMGYLPNSLFSIDIFPHPQITNRKIITIRRPHFNQSWYGWPLDIVTYDRIENFPNKLLKEIAFRFGAPPQKTVFNRLYSMFEAKGISEAYKPESEFSVLKVSELESKSPGIGWREILLAIFKPKDITPEDEILVECEQCLVNLASALKKMNTTLFKKLVNYDYAQKYFDQGLKLKLKELISHLKVWFANNIRASTYLDADTKKAAIEKLSLMNFYSPYNEETDNRNKIYQYYEDLKFNPKSTYFQCESTQFGW